MICAVTGDIMILRKKEKLTLAPGAVKIFAVGIAVISVELSAVIYQLSKLSTAEIAMLWQYIYTITEHLLMSLTLIVGGSLLFDLAVKEREFQN